MVRACWLAVGKSSQGYLLCKETEKAVVTVSFERKAGYQTDVCMVLSLCGSARTQNWAHSCTVSKTLPWTTAAHRQLGRHCFGRKRERILGG